MNRSAALRSGALVRRAAPLRDSEGACQLCAGLGDKDRRAFLENVAGQWLAGGEISQQTIMMTNANTNCRSFSC